MGCDNHANILNENEMRRRLAIYGETHSIDVVRDLGNLHDPNRQIRDAAILIPLIRNNGAWEVIFTRRTDTVPDHKGQVAFPGGAWEPEDRSLEQTATREAWEEIGLKPANVIILGRLISMLSITYFSTTPFVGIAKSPFVPIINDSEVSRVFRIPLAWLCQSGAFENRPFPHPVTGEIRGVPFFNTYDGETLWGLSAMFTIEMLKAFELIPHEI